MWWQWTRRVAGAVWFFSVVVLASLFLCYVVFVVVVVVFLILPFMLI